MLTAVLITLSLGIVMNIALYAYQKGWEKKNVEPIWIAIVWILVLLGLINLIENAKRLYKKIKKVGLANWYESWIYK
ncbi:TPA: hypothetical protein RD951_002013 [Listeria monocytogenes]|nr:hypothetical protein [Listeria monocytogenes]HDT8731666.1 hypothetical protein [Listeria monocytogenes]HDT8982585.1 hypothetical protein [Listeria monocytogenes]HDT9179141.1 hypothetical protein [Listeria monocytogenes]HDT9669770.1 hypothetical protein [Listeria monocytogenes]